MQAIHQAQRHERRRQRLQSGATHLGQIRPEGSNGRLDVAAEGTLQAGHRAGRLGQRLHIEGDPFAPDASHFEGQHDGASAAPPGGVNRHDPVPPVGGARQGHGEFKRGALGRPDFDAATAVAERHGLRYAERDTRDGGRLGDGEREVVAVRCLGRGSGSEQEPGGQTPHAN